MPCGAWRSRTDGSGAPGGSEPDVIAARSLSATCEIPPDAASFRALSKLTASQRDSACSAGRIAFLIGQAPGVLRGRLRLEPHPGPTAMEAYADGRVYLQTEVGWPSRGGSAPVLNFTIMEYWLLALLHAAAAYSDWAGAYGDVNALAVLSGPDTIVPSAIPVVGQSFSFAVPRIRTDTAPVHATSTVDALVSDAAQLQACARRIASDLLADLGHAETTMLKPGARSSQPGSTRRPGLTLSAGCVKRACPSMSRLQRNSVPRSGRSSGRGLARRRR
jgi:hypothetical protein